MSGKTEALAPLWTADTPTNQTVQADHIPRNKGYPDKYLLILHENVLGTH